MGRSYESTTATSRNWQRVCWSTAPPSLQTDRSNTFPFLNDVIQVKREHLALRWGHTSDLFLPTTCRAWKCEDALRPRIWDFYLWRSIHQKNLSVKIKTRRLLVFYAGLQPWEADFIIHAYKRFIPAIFRQLDITLWFFFGYRKQNTMFKLVM